MDQHEVKNVLEDQTEIDLRKFLEAPIIWNYGGRQVVHLAAEKGRLDILKRLIENGANINSKDDNGWTPLAYASYMGHLDVVKYLVTEKAKIKECDNEGYSPVIRAMENGHDEIVQYLSYPLR